MSAAGAWERRSGCEASARRGDQPHVKSRNRAPRSDAVVGRQDAADLPPPRTMPPGQAANQLTDASPVCWRGARGRLSPEGGARLRRKQGYPRRPSISASSIRRRPSRAACRAQGVAMTLNELRYLSVARSATWARRAEMLREPARVVGGDPEARGGRHARVRARQERGDGDPGRRAHRRAGAARARGVVATEIAQAGRNQLTGTLKLRDLHAPYLCPT